MLTRRSFVTGAIAAGVLMRGHSSFAKASQPSTAVNFEIPPHACDCHTHSYGDPQKFPLSPRHVNTPEGTLPKEMFALHRALHIERVVIVTPSAYGADNSSTLFGMKARGATARGIAVVNDTTPESEFDSLYRAGFRGARIISGVSGSGRSRRRSPHLSIGNGAVQEPQMDDRAVYQSGGGLQH